MTTDRFDLYSPVYQRVIDGTIAVFAFWLAYQAAFEGQLPAAAAVQLWELLFVVAIGRVASNEALCCYRTIWRYFGLREARTLGCSYLVFSLALFSLRLFISMPLLRIPVGIVVSELLLSLTGATAARVARRLLYERLLARAKFKASHADVLLIGAGRAGVNIANQLRASSHLRPVGFLDDDPKKIGLLVAGLKVLGPVSALDVVASKHHMRQVIVCIASPPREMLRRIWAICELLGVAVKVLPPLDVILASPNGALNFRNIEMDDLLGRQPIEQSADPDVLAIYKGKRILITGAGGSIGSELALQLARLSPTALLLLDKDENGLNDTYSRLQSDARSHASAIVADLRFAERVRGILQTLRPEIVFHAAAHKHVHLMESNPCEAITNNVTGTRNLVEESLRVGISRFVQVSTDKAVNPTSVMGASKRVCEMIVQAQGRRESTLFCCVRFGNVLGSRGSVVPIFQEQILRGGPVTLTHPDAQRFLMTIPEAVCLLIQAGTLANNRDILVLDMGEPVMIRKLARDLIELSGLSPDRDIRIEVTGLKPGEKLTELLMDSSSELHSTAIEKIKAIRTRPFDVIGFNNRLRALERAAWEGDTDAIYAHLAALNMGYTSSLRARPWPALTGRFVPGAAAAIAPATHLS